MTPPAPAGGSTPFAETPIGDVLRLSGAERRARPGRRRRRARPRPSVRRRARSDSVSGRLETFRTVIVVVAVPSRRPPPGRTRASRAGRRSRRSRRGSGRRARRPAPSPAARGPLRSSRPPLPTSALFRSSAVSVGRASATSAAAPATTAAAALEPVTVAKPLSAGVRGRQADARRDEVGLHPPVEGDAAGGERPRCPCSPGVRERPRLRELERRRLPASAACAAVGRDRDDRDADAVLDVERAGREARAGDEHRRRAGLRRVAHPALDARPAPPARPRPCRRRG